MHHSLHLSQKTSAKVSPKKELFEQLEFFHTGSNIFKTYFRLKLDNLFSNSANFYIKTQLLIVRLNLSTKALFDLSASER